MPCSALRQSVGGKTVIREDGIVARFIAEMPTGKPDDMVRFIAEDYLSKEGFKQKLYKGEAVWKKGNGLLPAPQFIKISSLQGHVHLEAWIKQAILPGVYVGEMGLDGAYGFAIKKVLKDRVDALARLLYQPLAAAAPVPAGPAPAISDQPPIYTAAAPASAYPATPYAAAPYAAPPMPPIPAAVHNPTGKAAASLICGLVAVVGCFIPLVGVGCGIAGIVTGAMGRGSTAKGMAVAGLVLSILFLVVSLVECAAMILRFWLSLI